MTRSFKDREERQQKRNRILLGVFIVVIMVGSTAGFFVGDNNTPADSIEYINEKGDKFVFVRSSDRYLVEIDDKTLFFYYLPFDVQKINLSEESMLLIQKSQAMFITYEPESESIQYIEQARFDLTSDLASNKVYVIPAVTRNNTDYSNFNIITCENATQHMPVIYLSESNITGSVFENNCLTFAGRRNDFLKFRDFIIYKKYGVI